MLHLIRHECKAEQGKSPVHNSDLQPVSYWTELWRNLVLIRYIGQNIL